MNKTLKKLDKNVEDVSNGVASKVAGTLTGAAARFFIGDPAGTVIGAAVGAAVEDVSRRLLSPREVSRMEKVMNCAADRYQELLKQGEPRKDLEEEKYIELFEGMLLKARNSYEEKKIPYLGNLFASAPFTNTPLENINQTLLNAERLSYRQLCIIPIIFDNMFEDPPNYSTLNFQRTDNPDQTNEKIEGVYEDIFFLLSQGIIGQTNQFRKIKVDVPGTGLIVPAYLVLNYPGRLLNNGMLLGTIPDEDRKQIIEAIQ